MRRNITVDPLAYANPVQNPEITELLDLASGEILDAIQWISARRYDHLIADRVSIRENLSTDPRFSCALCPVPVYLVSSPEKRFFFRHKSEDGSCPAKTRSVLSREEIQALKYDGQRESEAHKTAKAHIVRSLAADPTNSEIHSERQWRSTRNPSSRRQPDVQAQTVFGRVAFEVQLSTTFLDVVAERRSFYRQEGALLIWVMAGFNPDDRRLTTDDLLFSNNSNILVVDEETAQLSEQESCCYVRCHYRVPDIIDGSLRDCWKNEIVAFRDLTVDPDSQTAWAYDYAGQADLLLQRQEATRLEDEEDLRQRICSFWITRNQQTPETVSRAKIWQDFVFELSAKGVRAPINDRYDRAVTGLMNGVLSAREKTPVGWDFKSLIQVVHRICDGYPEHALALGFALREYECDDLIKAQDKKGKWAKRSQAIRQAILNGDERFVPDPETLPFLKFMFPSIGARVEKFLASGLAKSQF
ncbi:DUF6035 family protein [Ensifer sp. NPDC090286]|uniref:DUF6035 family protein n=1 Tax=Ensifer sp. NPDC090286 TaxID=3363991 RepID=UPI00383A7581